MSDASYLKSFLRGDPAPTATRSDGLAVACINEYDWQAGIPSDYPNDALDNLIP